MLKKCVSLGNPGLPVTPQGGEAVADMFAGVTKDGKYNASYFGPDQTNTQWVRLFAEWDFIWPNPPTALVSGSDPRVSWYLPPNPDPGQLGRLDVNIAIAKQANLRVILTTIGFPSWTNELNPPIIPPKTDPASYKFFFPLDETLLPTPGHPPPGTPPNGSMFEVYTYMYSYWVYSLMYRYHPNNPQRPFPEASIDYFEVVNEPNAQALLNTVQAAHNSISSNFHSTALMMRTSQSAKNYLNTVAFPSPDPVLRMRLLGPATSDRPYSWQSFTTNLIDELTDGGAKPFVDRDFGWSHHNYTDVNQIAQMIKAVGLKIAAILIADSPDQIAQVFYGRRTQGVRQRLRNATSGKPLWLGSGSEADPRIWLTEGGAILEQMPGYDNNAPPRAVNTDQRTAKQYQGQVLTLAAKALKLKGRGQPGEGVEMLTQFLFYDEPPPRPRKHQLFNPGLCNEYAAAPPTPTNPLPTPLETSEQEKRKPAFKAWTAFGS